MKMLKHLLMDPAYPDLVADWAGVDRCEPARNVNDTSERKCSDPVDPLMMLGQLEIAATRLW
jgi:hypothetical protein